jgi:hypothetical protein
MDEKTDNTGCVSFLVIVILSISIIMLDIIRRDDDKVYYEITNITHHPEYHKRVGNGYGASWLVPQPAYYSFHAKLIDKRSHIRILYPDNVDFDNLSLTHKKGSKISFESLKQQQHNK